tara:strand:- start:404 stop:607 length:204 start_codon:yes stop_codon:yes gene_type:complete
MAQNKLKLKVEALTRVVKHLMEEVTNNKSLAQGTLTAFQLHIGEESWNKLVDELKDIDNKKEPKLEL